jgi:quercetin dioxygenase-like cupin family protein
MPSMPPGASPGRWRGNDGATMNPYFSDADVPWTDLGDGIRRKIVAHTPQLMSVLVQFDKGAIGTPHAHEVHDQIAYVLSGSFEADIAGVKRVIKTGDAFIAVHGHLHGVVALEQDSTLLDQFSPRRDDYL